MELVKPNGPLGTPGLGMYGTSKKASGGLGFRVQSSGFRVRA